MPNRRKAQNSIEKWLKEAISTHLTHRCMRVEERLKITKGQAEAVYRRTDSTVTKRKILQDKQ